MESNDNPKPIVTLAWEYKWLVGGIASAVVLAGVTYTIVSEPIWEAEATIVFPSRAPSILGNAGMAEASGLAATLSGGPTPIKVYKGFLESQRTLDLVAEATGMIRKDVFRARSIVDQSMESSITISAQDKNSDLARKIVAEHLAALEKINAEVSDPLYADDSKVLGGKLKEQQTKVLALENAMLKFQQQAVTAPGVAPSGANKEALTAASPAKWQQLQRDLEIQIQKVNAGIRAIRTQIQQVTGKAAIMPSNLPPVRRWRDRLVELQYELKIKELTFGPSSPEVLLLKGSVEETNKSLKKELAAYSGAISSGALDPTADPESLSGLVAERFALEAQLDAVKRLAALAPSESMTMARLTRELTTQTAILQQLQAQYELARIQELRNPNRWQVLDEPRVAEEAVNKSLAKSGLIAGMLGLILGVLSAMIADSRNSRKNVRAESQVQHKKAA